jgi:hypothetical protein
LTSTLVPPQPTNVPCNNGSTVLSTTGSKFDLACGVEWFEDTLFLNYTIDLESCVNACSVWNMNSTVFCVGVTWYQGTFGPGGERGGSQCYYKWVMQNPGVLEPGAISARLQDVGTTVNPFL